MRARIRRLLQAGFSVLELLVSVAVVAVLAALVFPAVKGTMENAQSAGCVSNLRQIGSALIAFAGDHEGYLPRTVYFDSDGYPNEYWTTRIKSYLGIANPDLQVGQNILRCPARGPFNPENGENYTYGLNYGKASAVDGN